MSARKVIISGGGTGGHLYPALVVGRKLGALNTGVTLTYVGTERDVEKKIMSENDVRFYPLKIEGLKGRGWKSLKGMLLLPLSFFQSLVLLLRTKPDLVIGAGGYSSGPVVLLAAWLRIPTLILEQNAYPGFTNRLLARWVRKAAVAFTSSLPYFKGKGVLTGNPVREEFYALPSRPPKEELTLLVFGGSQGSHFLNERVTAALPFLAPKKNSVRVLHQTGPKDLEWVRKAYRSAGFDTAVVESFFSVMAAAFAEADLILSRAGATTLAEIIASPRAALLVPFGEAAEDHQTRNARELEAVGGAEMIPESNATPEYLSERILFYLHNKGQLTVMEKNLLPLRSEKAAETIAALCLTLMEERTKEAHP